MSDYKEGFGVVLQFPDRVPREQTPPVPERCDNASRDLLGRLLHPQSRSRLRSILTMQNIAFFKDFNFSDIKARRVSRTHKNLLLSILSKICRVIWLLLF